MSVIVPYVSHFVGLVESVNREFVDASSEIDIDFSDFFGGVVVTVKTCIGNRSVNYSAVERRIEQRFQTIDTKISLNITAQNHFLADNARVGFEIEGCAVLGACGKLYGDALGDVLLVGIVGDEDVGFYFAAIGGELCAVFELLTIHETNDVALHVALFSVGGRCGESLAYSQRIFKRRFLDSRLFVLGGLGGSTFHNLKIADFPRCGSLVGALVAECECNAAFEVVGGDVEGGCGECVPVVRLASIGHGGDWERNPRGFGGIAIIIRRNHKHLVFKHIAFFVSNNVFKSVISLASRAEVDGGRYKISRGGGVGAVFVASDFGCGVVDYKLCAVGHALAAAESRGKSLADIDALFLLLLLLIVDVVPMLDVGIDIRQFVVRIYTRWQQHRRNYRRR